MAYYAVLKDRVSCGPDKDCLMLFNKKCTYIDYRVSGIIKFMDDDFCLLAAIPVENILLIGDLSLYNDVFKNQSKGE